MVAAASRLDEPVLSIGLLTFAARTDGFVRGVTIVVLLLLSSVVVAILGVGARPHPSSVPMVVSVAAVFFVVAIVVYAYRYTPTGYRVDPGGLHVLRPAGDVLVPLETMQAVRAYDRFLGLSLKVPPGGNSGLFGLYGRFYRRDLGAFQLYGRAATGAVVVATSKGKILVTPERRDAFIAAVKEHLGA